MYKNLTEELEELIGGRTIVAICQELVEYVRGSRDYLKGEVPENIKLLEHYLTNWTPSDSLYDVAVWNLITAALEECKLRRM